MTVSKSEFSQKFISVMNINSLGMFASEALAGRFFTLTERMLSVNEHMNLTAITDIDGVILKHYADSLCAARLIPEGASLIDVGCGAGFPSLPLAIARPDLHVTALDSTAKRINYIRETAEIMGIDNIACIAARAEELGNDPAHRERYDISCARAVARLNVLSELCMPFVRVGGSFIAMKAFSGDETKEAVSAVGKLGGGRITTDSFELISDDGREVNPRCIITAEKISPTPKNYPRNNSQIKKKPL